MTQRGADPNIAGRRYAVVLCATVANIVTLIERARNGCSASKGFERARIGKAILVVANLGEQTRRGSRDHDSPETGTPMIYIVRRNEGKLGSLRVLAGEAVSVACLSVQVLSAFP